MVQEGTGPRPKRTVVVQKIKNGSGPNLKKTITHRHSKISPQWAFFQKLTSNHGTLAKFLNGGGLMVERAVLHYEKWETI